MRTWLIIFMLLSTPTIALANDREPQRSGSAQSFDDAYIVVQDEEGDFKRGEIKMRHIREFCRRITGEGEIFRTSDLTFTFTCHLIPKKGGKVHRVIYLLHELRLPDEDTPSRLHVEKIYSTQTNETMISETELIDYLSSLGAYATMPYSEFLREITQFRRR